MTDIVQKERHANSVGIFDPSKNNPKIVMVGAGGIGSGTAVALSKIGFSDITVIDFDEVENHNIQSQYYREQDIGKKKVDALKEVVSELSGVEIKNIDSVFEPSHCEGADIVIAAVDNMDVRKEIVLSAHEESMIIDGRMLGEVFEIYTLSGYDKDRYIHNSWFPEDGTNSVDCTRKSTSYNCLTIGSMITRLCVDIANGELEGLPYEITADMRNFLLFANK